MRAGRILREQMRDVDTAERVAERIRFRALADQVNREAADRFPIREGMSIDEMVEAARASVRWQEERIRELSAVVLA